MEFPLPWNSNYSVKTYMNLKSFQYDLKHEILNYHQFLVLHYLLSNKETRGLLIYHETGFGKSILAAAVSESFLQFHLAKSIVFLSPKPLLTNFKQNIVKYRKMKKNTSVDFQNYQFIVLGTPQTHLKVKEIFQQSFLTLRLVIVDEAHHFFQAVANGSKYAVQLYRFLLTETNVKLLFLTGTPLVNDAFELVPCFNLLHGKKSGETLFPESKRVFHEAFAFNLQKNTLQNEHVFSNRIRGLVSYFGELYSQKSKWYPTVLPWIIERIPMSTQQFVVYRAARKKERTESFQSRNKMSVKAFNDSKLVGSSYRVMSRIVSNFLILFDRNFVIKPSYCKNLSTYSPKFKCLLANLNKHQNQLGLVYSNFVHKGGVNVIADVLRYHGFTQFPEKGHQRFAVFTGDTHLNMQKKILDAFTNPKNVTGKDIWLLLISSVGSEGLDLKNIRHVHIVEPYWHYTQMHQVVSRANRFKSHVDLPKSDWTIQPYVYLSVFPETKLKNYKLKDTLSTDEHLWKLSFDKQKNHEKFLTLLKSIAIDCQIHVDLNKISPKILRCNMCVPNGQKVYDVDITKDILSENKCEQMSDQNVSKEIKPFKFEGITYFVDDTHEIPVFFERNSEFESVFTQISQQNALHSKLMTHYLTSKRID